MELVDAPDALLNRHIQLLDGQRLIIGILLKISHGRRLLFETVPEDVGFRLAGRQVLDRLSKLLSAAPELLGAIRQLLPVVSALFGTARNG